MNATNNIEFSNNNPNEKYNNKRNKRDQIKLSERTIRLANDYKNYPSLTVYIWDLEYSIYRSIYIHSFSFE